MTIPARPTAATRFVRAADRLVVAIVATWHVIYDPVAILLNAGQYRSLTVQLVAWLFLAIIALIGSVHLLQGRGSAAQQWTLVVVAILVGELVLRGRRMVVRTPAHAPPCGRARSFAGGK